jgi:hypothetical protein
MLINSLCKKTPTTALLSFLKQSFTTCKLLGFKHFESLVFGAFWSKTENFVVFLLALNKTKRCFSTRGSKNSGFQKPSVFI